MGGRERRHNERGASCRRQTSQAAASGVNRIVLDAGALIGLERGDRKLWAALKFAVTRDEDVVVPTTALAQTWRGIAAQARLGAALQFCTLAPFDPLAKAVGTLCGRAGTKDVCDAHVAIVAAARDTVLYTSDPDDLERLFSAYRRGRPVIVRC
jgi:hypothetical protein